MSSGASLSEWAAPAVRVNSLARCTRRQLSLLGWKRTCDVMSENRAAKFFWHLQDIYQELKPCRFAFVVAIIGAIVFLGVEQGREVLRAHNFVSRPRPLAGARMGKRVVQHYAYRSLRQAISRSLGGSRPVCAVPVPATTPPLMIGDCKFLNINDCLGAAIGSDLRPRLPIYTQASCNMHHRAGLEEDGLFHMSG
jgi:hypothetical protein